MLGAVHGSAPVDIGDARAELAWTDIVETGQKIATTAAQVADEIGAQGPNLTAIDATVVAVARELNAALVSSDRDLTHPEIRKVVDVDAYLD